VFPVSEGKDSYESFVPSPIGRGLGRGGSNGISSFKKRFDGRRDKEEILFDPLTPTLSRWERGLMPVLRKNLRLLIGMRGFSHGNSNNLQNSVEIAKQVMIPEPQYPITQRLKIAGSYGVFVLLFGVLSAIEFDYQLRFKAKKVGDIRADWLLPPEFATGNLPISEAAP
jgi:hypothetical protein